MRSGPAGEPCPAPPSAAAPRQLLMTVWQPGPGAFAARVLLADGSLHEFDSPFELVRFLGRPPPPEPAPAAATAPGLR